MSKINRYQLKKLLSENGFEGHLIYSEHFVNFIKYIENLYTSNNINFPIWLNIDSRMLRKTVPGKERRFSQITDHRRPLYLIVAEVLQKVGVIQINHSYLPTRYSKSYRLVENYRPKMSTHKNKTTLQIQKHLNRRLYRKLYTVSPRAGKFQPVSLRSSGLPSTDLKSLAEGKETTPSLEEALKICQRLSTQTLSEYVESKPDDLPKPVDLVTRHQQRPSVSVRLESSVAQPDIVKEKIGIVFDKYFTDRLLLQKTIFALKSQAEMIIGIDNRGLEHYVRKFSDDFEIDYREVLPGHYQWTTRSLRSTNEHYKKYTTLNYIKRDRIFADKVDRVIIFKPINRKLNKNTLYLMQELDRQGVTYEIKER